MDYQNVKVYEIEAQKVMVGLRIADCMAACDTDEDIHKNDENVVPYNLKELAISDVLTCSYCSVTFIDSSEQRNHYKLDWHRYNLKRALTGKQPVPEDVFVTLADDISSISGSDSESSGESDAEASDLITKLNSEKSTKRFNKIRHTKAFFENQENKILSVYKCLLHSKKQTLLKDELVDGVWDLIRNPKKWMIILLGGGHFAAAIYDNGTIINHKTFHCYTVRAKQGGSQSTRDNKGGSHPKSAGASLRRYNEQALVQHVQEIIATWSDTIKQCSLILYRATGPYNRGVLFGGKNPPLLKTDPRLRNIPFPTRRATFNEVKRVHDMLSSIEIYGSADNFRDKFPRSPDRRTWSLKMKSETTGPDCDIPRETKETSEKRTKAGRRKSKERESPIREMPVVTASPTETTSSDEGEYELVSNDVTIRLEDLLEYDDTVPCNLKKSVTDKEGFKKKKKKKFGSKQKEKSERKEWNEEFERLRLNLINSCKKGDKEMLIKSLSIYETLPQRETSGENEKSKCIFTKEDFIDCLNGSISEDNKNTILHTAALKCLPEFITVLLLAGADPTIRNKNKLTPYLIAGDKETRNSFRSFAASYPDKYDLKKANIPEPLSKEDEKVLEEKKKEKKKIKRIREKIKKQEDREKKNEEIEKEKFLALSDREKCALSAERRILTSSTANLTSGKPPVLSRCFQCGIDITGKVPFEYGNNRFCTIPCLKAHRSKTNSYGQEL